jgi:NitT/TauT family transport system substrate-binding protein
MLPLWRVGRACFFAFFLGFAAATPLLAQTPEKPDVVVAIGGNLSQLYFLPVTLAQSLGYFKEAGLTPSIVETNAGTKGVQAVVGGSADVVAVGYEHTLVLQARGIATKSFVLFGRFPGNALGIKTTRLTAYPTMETLKGSKIAISSPGSATDTFLKLVLIHAGLKPDDASVVAVGNAAGAVAAIRVGGQVDAISGTDPVISELTAADEIKIVADSRTEEGTREIYGGPWASGCLFARSEFLAKNPNTAQALATAIVRAMHWIRTHNADEILAHLPRQIVGPNADLYRFTLKNNLASFSHDGLISQEAAETVLRASRLNDEAVRNAKIDLSSTYDNSFVQHALLTVGTAP